MAGSGRSWIAKDKKMNERRGCKFSEEWEEEEGKARKIRGHKWLENGGFGDSAKRRGVLKRGIVQRQSSFSAGRHVAFKKKLKRAQGV
ncbi:hypothetical protein H6P81_003438 [Aristolochia fimbriata]|uniref:Uncharacterized protein n=1 Tax=Aristolochia fimbriata TaxID=158543 RepID=A0AAV7FCK0_ARIFI|nr:hypothetical protein H6P81_003438 [Aristolochia fimbriata]